jgi:hypothetical protein
MATLVVLFNLRAGVSVSEYENWARTTDLPAVNGLQSVDQFRVLRCKGLLGQSVAAPYQYVETIEVNSLDGLFADIASPQMQAVAAQFQQFADNPIFIHCESIAAAN